MCVILDLLLFLQVAGKLFPNGFKQHTGSYKLMFRRYLIKRSNQALGFLDGSVVKNLPANTGNEREVSSVPGLGRSTGGGNGNPPQ